MSNFNECDGKKASSDILKSLYKLGSIRRIDFVGNVESKKFNKAVSAAFSAKNI